MSKTPPPTIAKGTKLMRVAVYVTTDGMHDRSHAVVVADRISKKDKHLWEVRWRTSATHSEALSTVDDRDISVPVVKLLPMDGARNGLLMVVSGCVPAGEPSDHLRERCLLAATAQAAEMHARWGSAVAGMRGRTCAKS